MAIFNYTALDNDNKTVSGVIEASNERDAREKIRLNGFKPMSLSLTNTSSEEADKQEAADKISKNKIPKLSLNDKIDFTSTFQMLSMSGIPVIESLVFIENDSNNLKIRLVAKELKRQILAGSTFATTIAKYPEVFDRIYIGLTKAGEDSGELEKTLERLLDILKKQVAINSRVIGALMYPVFVIILAIVIVLIMLVFVFPAFDEMFANQGKTLPPITAAMMVLGKFLKAQWYLIPIGAIVTMVGLWFISKWEVSRRFIDKHVLKIPLIGELFQFSNFSNFISVMQVAYEAGIPIVDTLYLANLTINNYTLRDKIVEASGKVQQGQQLSLALKMTDVMPKMILFMISTGEQSGRLGDMLHQSVIFIDKKLDSIVDALTKMIEPIMLIVIGGIVLILALALYLPLFQSYMQ